MHNAIVVRITVSWRRITLLRYIAIKERTTSTVFVWGDKSLINIEYGRPLLNKELFFKFMDSLYYDESTFYYFSESLRDFIIDDSEYLDKAMLFRDFVRERMIHFSKEKANALPNR